MVRALTALPGNPVFHCMSVIPVSRDLTPSSSLHGCQSHMGYTDIYADKTPIHIIKKKNFGASMEKVNYSEY